MHILFVCSGNTCRSPMAAALCQAIAKERAIDIMVDSAGLYTQPDMPASRNAQSVMQEEYGADLSGHRARPLAKELIDAADIVLGMTDAHVRDIQKRFPNDKTAMLGAWAGEEEEIADPFGGAVSEYLQCARQMEKLIRKGLVRVAKAEN